MLLGVGCEAYHPTTQEADRTNHRLCFPISRLSIAELVSRVSYIWLSAVLIASS